MKPVVIPELGYYRPMVNVCTRCVTDDSRVRSAEGYDPPKMPQSPFGRSSTAAEVRAHFAGQAEFQGQRAFVTGANSGIGFETAVELVKAGMTVHMACRNAEKGADAANRLKELVLADPDVALDTAELAKRVHVEELDLSDLESVRQCGQAFEERQLALDRLVLNAGVMAPPKGSKTEQGFELQFGVNHLAHFLLHQLLEASLERALAPRVVVVSSYAHKMSGVRFDDVHGEQAAQMLGGRGRWLAYGSSKTANILFASELNRRAKAAGKKTRAYSLHPGAVDTNLMRYTVPGWAQAKGWILKTPQQGAATTMYAALAPELDQLGGGFFLADCHIELPVNHAMDPQAAHRLWAMSENLLLEQATQTVSSSHSSNNN